MRVWTGRAPKWVADQAYGTPRQFIRHHSVTPHASKETQSQTQRSPEECDQPQQQIEDDPKSPDPHR